MHVKTLEFNDPMLGQVDLWPERQRSIAFKAIKGKGILIGVVQDESILGIANYRVDKNGDTLKRINTAVKLTREGIGAFIIKELFHRHPIAQWTYSQYSAWGWCEALGMKCIQTLEDGRRQYYWEVEDIKKWVEHH